MSEPAQNTEDYICGIRKEIVEKALILIRDNYRKADESCFFLEERAGINNVQAISNMRDAISHLVTLLDPNIDEVKREHQLANAEEHLRRAIIEPYEIAIDNLLVEFYKIYVPYKEELLPVKDRHPVLNSAPNHISVNARLKEFHDLTTKGRSGKGKNLWDTAWEEGVLGFVDAFEKLSALKADIETHWYSFQQIRRDRKTTALTIWGIVATIITFILGAIIAWLLTKK